MEVSRKVKPRARPKTMQKLKIIHHVPSPLMGKEDHHVPSPVMGKEHNQVPFAQTGLQDHEKISSQMGPNFSPIWMGLDQKKRARSHPDGRKKLVPSRWDSTKKKVSSPIQMGEKI